MSTTIEIIIPAYNCSKTVGRTFRSLINQTNKNFKVKFVDDCSTEDIKSIVDAHKDLLNIEYTKTAVHSGCGMARQKGIDETDAEYIAFLDSDDVLLPNAVQVWLDAIELRHPDIVCTPIIHANENGLELKQHYMGMTHGKAYNVDFLKKYDIVELPEVDFLDDVFFNRQAVDLVRSISMLKDLTCIWIKRYDSMSNSFEFLSTAKKKEDFARELAAERVSKFRKNPTSTYLRLCGESRMLLMNNKDHFDKALQEIDRSILEL